MGFRGNGGVDAEYGRDYPADLSPAVFAIAALGESKRFGFVTFARSVFEASRSASVKHIFTPLRGLSSKLLQAEKKEETPISGEVTRQRDVGCVGLGVGTSEVLAGREELDRRACRVLKAFVQR